MADTTSTLNAGSGGDVMDESLVTQSDGVTKAKRVRVALGDDSGKLYGTDNPVPVADGQQRRAAEQAQLASMERLGIGLPSRQVERMRFGNRLDLIDIRGPGGR